MNTSEAFKLEPAPRCYCCSAEGSHDIPIKAGNYALCHGCYETYLSNESIVIREIAQILDLRTRSIAAEERAQAKRWSAPWIARVIHPKYGSVVVPCGSTLAAMECAAEYWGCDVSEIISAATVTVAEPGTVPVPPPAYIHINNKEE